MSMQSDAYRLTVDPVPGTVSAWRNGHAVARSDDVRIMYETRLAPTLYFPADTVQGLAPAPSNHRTFCPFKGTAAYRDLTVDGVLLRNAAWSYDQTLTEEAAPIEGLVAFMPDVIERYEGAETLLADRPDGHVNGALVDWLMREAWLCDGPVALTRELGHRLVRNGVAVSRLNVLIWSLHPQIAGTSYLWTRASDRVERRNNSYESLRLPAYVNSPLRYVSEGLGGVRQRLNGGHDEFSFPIMAELKAQGASDYVAMPLPFSNGQINALTLTCDHPDGFTTANLGLIFECSAVISRFYEVHTQFSSASVLLETYLGERTGARVLGGEIRRGDGDDIDAAVLFCDLRGSSRWEETLPRADYLAMLNTFFETVVDQIRAHKGEVLKFIGDAVLAIFPAEADPALACTQATQAARAIVERVADLAVPGRSERLDCVIGASFGDVTYGNVGAVDRLDFTVVGAAANVAARLSDLGKRLDAPVLLADSLAQRSADPLQALGTHRLHNVSGSVSVFAP